MGMERCCDVGEGAVERSGRRAGKDGEEEEDGAALGWGRA